MSCNIGRAERNNDERAGAVGGRVSEGRRGGNGFI